MKVEARSKAGQLAQLTRCDILHGFSNWRWVAVPAALFVGGLATVDYVSTNPVSNTPRSVNLWDVPLSVMVGASSVLFLFVLGFMLVSGDLYIRDRDRGTAVLTLTRSSSKTTWWTAKLLALGVLAATYSTIAFGAILAASATRLPISLGWSPAADLTWTTQQGIYPRFHTLAPAVFLLFVVVYTALALWAIGAITLTFSVLAPRATAVLAFEIAWVVGADWVLFPVYQRNGIGTIDPIYHVSYAIHFPTGNTAGVPWWFSLVVFIIALVLAVVTGGYSLRKTTI